MAALLLAFIAFSPAAEDFREGIGLGGTTTTTIPLCSQQCSASGYDWGLLCNTAGQFSGTVSVIGDNCCCGYGLAPSATTIVPTTTIAGGGGGGGVTTTMLTTTTPTTTVLGAAPTTSIMSTSTIIYGGTFQLTTIPFQVVSACSAINDVRACGTGYCSGGTCRSRSFYIPGITSACYCDIPATSTIATTTTPTTTIHTTTIPTTTIPTTTIPTTTTPTTTISPWINDCQKECSNSGRGYRFCASWGGSCSVNDGILLPAGNYGCQPEGFVCCCAWKDVRDACESVGYPNSYCANTLHELYNPATGCSGIWLDDANYLCSPNFRACCIT